jgi:THO complex subunit 6
MPSITSLPHYTTVLAQVFSPDGEYYAAGTAAGDLAVWRVSSLVARGEKRSHIAKWRPHHSSPQCDVHSLASTEAFLLTGGRGEVMAWAWDTIVQGEVGQPDWDIQVPGRGEINSMLVLPESGTQGRLVLGTGNSNIYMYDLETRQLVTTLTGHTDYVHSVASGQGEGDTNTLVSGGEDGTVRLWDPRKGEQVHCLTPSEKSELARPHLGRHINCVAVSSDWMACGGGPRLALWHLRTLAPAVTIPPVETEAKTASFHDDIIMCGGRKVVYQANFSGEVKAEVGVSFSTTYSLAWQDTESHKVLCVAGSSSYIDICAPNFNYKDATISFPAS